MYKVQFMAGEGRYSTKGVNFMICDTGAEELYAEIEVPDELLDEGELTYEAEMYGYEELKAQIIRQAEEAGINTEDLDFC